MAEKNRKKVIAKNLRTNEEFSYESLTEAANRFEKKTSTMQMSIQRGTKVKFNSDEYSCRYAENLKEETLGLNKEKKEKKPKIFKFREDGSKEEVGLEDIK